MRVGLATLLVLALGSTGCGGEADESERSPVAVRLAALCTAAREDVEGLGLPAEAGPAVLRPWAARGSRLARDVGELEGGTGAEQAQLGRLAVALDAYYEGLRLAFNIYTSTGSSEAFAAAADRATANLEAAESLARGLGVSECAERPFADDPPPG